MTRKAFEAGSAHLADVSLDHQKAEQHDREPDHAECEHGREGCDQQHEAEQKADDRPLDHPRRVAVEGRVGDLLHQLRVGDRQVGLDLLENPLLVFG